MKLARMGWPSEVAVRGRVVRAQSVDAESQGTWFTLDASDEGRSERVTDADNAVV